MNNEIEKMMRSTQRVMDELHRSGENQDAYARELLKAVEAVCDGTKPVAEVLYVATDIANLLIRKTGTQQIRDVANKVYDYDTAEQKAMGKVQIRFDIVKYNPWLGQAEESEMWNKVKVELYDAIDVNNNRKNGFTVRLFGMLKDIEQMMEETGINPDRMIDESEDPLDPKRVGNPYIIKQEIR